MYHVKAAFYAAQPCGTKSTSSLFLLWTVSKGNITGVHLVSHWALFIFSSLFQSFSFAVMSFPRQGLEGAWGIQLSHRSRLEWRKEKQSQLSNLSWSGLFTKKNDPQFQPKWATRHDMQANVPFNNESFILPRPLLKKCFVCRRDLFFQMMHCRK